MTNTWRRIDSYGKLFPLVENPQNIATFRMSIVLNDNIVKKKLKKAVQLTLNKFNDFRVTLKKGFFRHYLQTINNDLLIEEKNTKTCSKINIEENNGYLFKVTYYENIINVDFYHILTDGTGASLFIKELTERYLDLVQGAYSNNKELLHCRDGYKSDFKVPKSNKNKLKNSGGKSFVVQDEKLKQGSSITHIIADLKEISTFCKTNEMTITQYITSIITKSIYETNKDKMNKEHKIKISIPVNLRKFYNIETVSNFFDYFNVNISKEEAAEEIKMIMDKVKKIFNEELKADQFLNKVKQNVTILNQRIFKAIPLVIKKEVTSFIYKTFIDSSTVLLTNVGKITIEEKYNKYVDNILFISNPEEKTIKCAICSFKNKLSITFSTFFKNCEVENKCCELFQADDINIFQERIYA